MSGEYYCKCYYLTYGLKTICLRYFNVFGSYQNLESQYSAVIPIFINAILKNEHPTIYGDGYQTRDFIYIDNVVDVNLLVINTDKADGQVLNVCQGREINLFELIKIINKILGVNIEPVFAEPRPGDIKRSCGDTSRIKSILNYDPKVSLEEGIKKTIDWYQRKFHH